MYHGACLEQWIETGGVSCPLCRGRVPGAPEYRMTVLIENVRTGTTVRTDHSHEVAEHILEAIVMPPNENFSTTEINFPVASLESLQHILRDLGLQIDPLVLHTE